MQSYLNGRKAANHVHVIGWIVVVLGLIVAIASIVLGTWTAASAGLKFVGLPLFVPAFCLLLVGSCSILFAHVARAVFDIAERGA